MIKIAENKLTSGIYKVIRTTNDEYALACSGGLYFAKLDPVRKLFTLQKEFLLADHLVTQVHEVQGNKFVVGCWGVPWVALVDKVKKTLLKIPCPLPDELQCTDLIPLPSFNLRTFPLLVQRNSKALNLVNLQNFTMHRLVMRNNQSGSFQKLMIDVDKYNHNKLRLIFVTREQAVEEVVIEPSFM